MPDSPSGAAPVSLSRSPDRNGLMLLRLFHHDATACASYLFGCTTHDMLAVVDPHVELEARSTLRASEHATACASRMFARHSQRLRRNITRHCQGRRISRDTAPARR